MLPKVESAAPGELKADKCLVIVSVDRGRFMVVLDGTDYLQNVKRLLESCQSCGPCATNLEKMLTREIYAMLSDVKNSGAISPVDRRMARAQDMAFARFYGHSKVRKVGVPLRPIVSLKGGRTGIPDTDVLERTGILNVYTTLIQLQLRCSGHLVRMDYARLPKRLFYGDIAAGSRRQGRQIRRYKDTLKSSLKRLQINPTNLEDLAHDRATWRRTVKTGAVMYEDNRIAATKVKREARKSRQRTTATNVSTGTTDIPDQLHRSDGTTRRPSVRLLLVLSAVNLL
nr:unnamed protein product [Spirometra erinaceieuropaei]